MNKQIIKIIIIFLFIVSCNGFKPLKDQDPLFGEKKTNKAAEHEKTVIKKLFRLNPISKKEFNPTLKINLKNSFNTGEENLVNNNGRYNYEKFRNKTLKFKFSKIDNFNQNEPKIIFYKDDLIFFDKKGTLLRYNNSSKIIWKSNIYSKIEKKIKPFLYLANNRDVLIVTDDISKYYALNISNGDLIWSENNTSPFNSEIKIYKNKFYVTDSENILHCFSLKDGTKIWSFKTENVLIKSQQKLSVVISDNIVYFNNSIGDITALNADSGKLIWQLPTQNNNVYAQSFSLKSSDLVVDNKTIFFSNNRNELYSINSKTGLLNWQQQVNSIMRPIIVDDIIFTVSFEGFLVIIEKISGNIIRITDIFNIFKEKKRLQIYPVGFVVGIKNIYLTTTNGRLLTVNIQTGKTENVIKIDRSKISKPFVKKGKLFIIKDNEIIRFD